MTKLILLITFLLSINTLAYDKLISFQDFVSMPQQKQIETVKLIHKFLVEAELQQNIHIQKTNKYHTYIKIMDFFIASSYAGNNQDLMKSIPRKHKCYYGGWISFMYNGLCTHPRLLNTPSRLRALKAAADEMQQEGDTQEFNQTKIYKFYIEGVAKTYSETLEKGFVGVSYSTEENKTKYKEETNSCNNQSSLPCNPEIYGTKGGKAFCVESSQDKGLNAAYLCQQALEDLKTAEKESAYKEIIKNGVEGNSGLFDSLTTMYDTCLCKGQGDPKGEFKSSINEAYAQKIFYSRTCAGILNQTQRIKDTFLRSCAQNNFEQNENLAAWKLYLSKLDEVLNDDITRLRQKHQELNGLSTLSKSVQEYFTEDESLFKQIADENYQKAQDNKLCPVLSNKPSLKLTYNAENKELTLEVLDFDTSEKPNKDLVQISHAKLAEDKSVASSTMNDIPQGSEASDQKEENSHIFTFAVTTVADDSTATGTATINGVQLRSNTVTIPGTASPQTPIANCNIQVAGDQATITPSVEGVEEDQIEIVEINLSGVSATVQTEKNIFTLQNYNGTDPLEATGKIKVAGQEIDISACQYPIPSEGKSEPDRNIASCSLEIKQERGENGGVKLEAEISFTNSAGDTIFTTVSQEAQERSTASNDEVPNFSLTWLDLSRPKTETADTDESDNESDQAVISDEDTTETEEDSQRELSESEQLINTYYTLHTGSSTSTEEETDLRTKTGEIPKAMVEQKFKAILKADNCEKIAETTISALTPKADNTRPIQQQMLPNNIQRPSGAILNGAR